jgi:hypothetical protein
VPDSRSPGEERPRLEVADVVRAHGAAYRQQHALSPEQARTLENCRTSALGGHTDVCDHCGHERPAYNSCRNRHCPKCQALIQATWLEARKARLLDTHYFHVVFTLPQELRSLAHNNRRSLRRSSRPTSPATVSATATAPSPRPAPSLLSSGSSEPSSRPPRCGRHHLSSEPISNAGSRWLSSTTYGCGLIADWMEPPRPSASSA